MIQFSETNRNGGYYAGWHDPVHDEKRACGHFLA